MTGSDEIDYDTLHSWLPIAQAADRAGVAVPVIRQWIRRGYRARNGAWTHCPAQWTTEGRWEVKPIDALKAEAATRRRARRNPRGG